MAIPKIIPGISKVKYRINGITKKVPLFNIEKYMYFLYSLNPRSDALAIAKKESETHNKAAIGSIKIKIKAATDVKITNNVVI